MGTGEVGSPKWQAKMMKMKGLQKLRWYCQACEKQCRDEHGFRLHVASPSHAAKMKTAAAKKSEFSKQFEYQFCQLLKMHHEKLVSANKTYNELIQDRQHVRMSATRFPSLTAFIKHLESRGFVRIVAMEPELTIQYIDKDAILRKEKQQQEHSRNLAEQERAERSALEAAIVYQAESSGSANETGQTQTEQTPGEATGQATGQATGHPSETQITPKDKRPKIAFSLRKK